MTEISSFPLQFVRSDKEFVFRSVEERVESAIVRRVDRSTVSFRSARVLCELIVKSPTESDAMTECVVDTGAPLSVFPQIVWLPWSDRIEWFEPADEVSTLAIGVKSISGEMAPAKLGRISVSLRNKHPSQPSTFIETPTFEILGKFMMAETDFNRAVLGIAGNAMDRWQRLEVDFQNGPSLLFIE